MGKHTEKQQPTLRFLKLITFPFNLAEQLKTFSGM